MSNDWYDMSNDWYDMIWYVEKVYFQYPMWNSKHINLFNESGLKIGNIKDLCHVASKYVCELFK